MARGRKPKAATASQNDNTVASRLRSRTVPTEGEDESTPLVADTTQQDKNVSRDPQPESIERDSTRKQILMTCSCISKLIKERGSRKACLGLLNKLDDMLATVERLNLLVVDPSDADEFSKQAQIQIDLFTLIELKKEDVEAYVTLRADDEWSCMQSVKSVPPTTRHSTLERNEEIQSEKLLAEAQKRAAEAQQEAAQLRERLEEVNKKAELATKEATKTIRCCHTTRFSANHHQQPISRLGRRSDRRLAPPFYSRNDQRGWRGRGTRRMDRPVLQRPRRSQLVIF